MFEKTLMRALMAALLVLSVAAAHAVTIDMVPVGNPGNAGAPAGGSVPGGHGPDRECGAVDHNYYIGKYEVTAGQYTEFLNAVAGVDTYGLYNVDMWNHPQGCKIQQWAGSGTIADPYKYKVAPDQANRPVNLVSWGDAARFTNWLQNGQPQGAQGPSTTETGAYVLNGAITDDALMAVGPHSAGATWWIPTEDEWCKAGHYDPNKPGGPGYWLYPTKSDTPPAPEPPPGGVAPPGSANFAQPNPPPYGTTPVGAYLYSPSPYGTFDQGGNVMEWGETAVTSSTRIQRGGLWASGIGLGTDGPDLLRFTWRHDEDYPTHEDPYSGFRVASSVPEPGSIGLLVAGVLGLLAYAWQWRMRAA